MDWTKGHFEIFVFQGSRARLEDAERLKAFMAGLVEKTGMRNITDPRAIRVGPTIAARHGDPKADEGGVSGDVVAMPRTGLHVDVMIGTSHYAIHTWTDPEGVVKVGGAVLTMYSCRDFDPSVVKKYIRNFLEGEQIYSSDVSLALAADNIIQEQREALALAHTLLERIAGTEHGVTQQVARALAL